MLSKIRLACVLIKKFVVSLGRCGLCLVDWPSMAFLFVNLWRCVLVDELGACSRVTLRVYCLKERVAGYIDSPCNGVDGRKGVNSSIFSYVLLMPCSTTSLPSFFSTLFLSPPTSLSHSSDMFERRRVQAKKMAFANDGGAGRTDRVDKEPERDKMAAMSGGTMRVARSRR